jgi:hypothetical protein
MRYAFPNWGLQGENTVIAREPKRLRQSRWDWIWFHAYVPKLELGNKKICVNLCLSVV